MTSSSTIRVERRDRFSIVDRRALTDDRLSFKAKGVLAFMVGLPNGSIVNRESLAAIGPDGETSIRSALKELTAAGYLVRSKVRQGNGQMVTETVLYEYPPEVGNPPPVPEVGNPTAGKPTAKREEEQEEELSLGATAPDGESSEPDWERDLPPSPSRVVGTVFPEPFEKTWVQYPKERRKEKRGTYKAWRATVARLATGGTTPRSVMLLLYRATVIYGEAMHAKVEAGGSWEYVKLSTTFFGPSEPWRDYLNRSAPASHLKEWEA